MELKVIPNEATGRIHLAGNLTATSAKILAEMFATASGEELQLDLSRIATINTPGVRLWTEFMTKLGAKVHVLLVNCSGSFIDSANLFPAMIGPAEVHSFVCPYDCKACNRVVEQIYLSKDVSPESPPPAPRCERCGTATIPAVTWQEYASFLLT